MGEALASIIEIRGQRKDRRDVAEIVLPYRLFVLDTEMKQRRRGRPT